MLVKPNNSSKWAQMRVMQGWGIQNYYIFQVVFQTPLEIQTHTVPYMKGLMNG